MLIFWRESPGPEDESVIAEETFPPPSMGAISSGLQGIGMKPTLIWRQREFDSM